MSGDQREGFEEAARRLHEVMAELYPDPGEAKARLAEMEAREALGAFRAVPRNARTQAEEAARIDALAAEAESGEPRRGRDRGDRGTLGAGILREEGSRTQASYLVAEGSRMAGQHQHASTRDPAVAVLTSPQVPQHRRRCGTCDQPVGRSWGDGRPGLAEGFCRNCGTRFSFRPKLRRGELVGGQYEVLGCLAHGGLGWIYLAQDHNASDRWVVLKGLLNTGDADAMAAAFAERQFLAEVEHPNIVQIYNFVTHADPDTGEASGYIVMEYVGGKSLKQILQDARAAGGSVPLEHALAYAIEVLPALGYLHDRGLVYGDFKPDNVIQAAEQLKLIDMSSVRPADDDGPPCATVGYQAPEIQAEGPSPASDLYSVGRVLAVLTFEFRGFQGEYKYRLPDSEPLLAEQESFARLLRRATHPDPSRRFQSAGEMAEQVTGVLREVLSACDGQPRPWSSRTFSPELRAVGTDLVPVRATGAQASPPAAAEMAAGLPAPLADGTDSAVRYLAALDGLEPEQHATVLRAVVAGETGVPPAVAESPETRLALVRALIAAGDPDSAGSHLAELATGDPADWRIGWYNGLRELADGRPEQARAAFGTVYEILPGELAPKLALGFAAESAGDLTTARHYYQLVWTTDRSYVSAAFGAARACLADGNRAAAIAAVDGVPKTSSHHAAAQTAAIRLLLAAAAGVTTEDLREAESRLGRLSLDDLHRQQLTTEILRAALDRVIAQRPGDTQGGTHWYSERILGCEQNERALRFALAYGYQTLASMTPDPARKAELVNMANAIRPWTVLRPRLRRRR